MFTNYLATPHQTTKHIHPLEIRFDLDNRRVISPAEEDFTCTFTTVQDVTRVVTEAIEYTGVWPVIGGINGHTLKNSELLKFAEEIRGMYQVYLFAT